MLISSFFSGQPQNQALSIYVLKLLKWKKICHAYMHVYNVYVCDVHVVIVTPGISAAVQVEMLASSRFRWKRYKCCKVEPVLRDHCIERPPVLRDQFCRDKDFIPHWIQPVLKDHCVEGSLVLRDQCCQDKELHSSMNTIFVKATFPPNISTIIERKKGGPPGAILDRSSVQNRSCKVHFQIRPL